MTAKKESFSTISWDATTRCVLGTLNGFVAGVEYRNNLDKGVALLKEKKANKWLADMRAGTVMTPDDLEWVRVDWTPRALKAGLKWIALILPDNVLVEMQIKRAERITEKAGGLEFVSGYFDDMNEARAWLRSVG